MGVVRGVSDGLLDPGLVEWKRATATLTVEDEVGTVRIDSLFTPRPYRGEGRARQLMGVLILAAESQGRDLVVRAQAFDRLSEEDLMNDVDRRAPDADGLRRFYNDLGFGSERGGRDLWYKPGWRTSNPVRA